MRLFTKATILATGLTLAAFSVGIAPGQAQTTEGWDYAIDSFNDGHDRNGRVGDKSVFEFYAMALQATADSVFVAINANLNPMGGAAESRADKGYVTYGDLFLNFTGDNLNDANGSLFGINFVEGSDSGAPALGVYGDVTGMNVAGKNAGFDHLTHHYNTVANRGGSANMADLEYTDPYFGSAVNKKHTALTSIQSGTFLGEITSLNSNQLAAMGLDFGGEGATGTYTFGFSFDRSLLPDGDFIAHVFAECINDGMALVGSLPRTPETPGEGVPEPASALSLLALGGMAVAAKYRSRLA